MGYGGCDDVERKKERERERSWRERERGVEGREIDGVYISRPKTQSLRYVARGAVRSLLIAARAAGWRACCLASEIGHESLLGLG